MNRSRLVFFLLSLALLVPIVSGTLSRAATEDGQEDDSLTKHLSVFSEVLSLIRRAYVDETSVDELLAGALDGATDALDPLATFVPASEVEAFERARQVGPRHSGLTVARQRGISFLIAVDRGSPGETAGLEQGDIVSEIAGRSTRNLPLWRLQSILAGEPGTQLPIEVLRRGQTKELMLTLGTYELGRAAVEERRGMAVMRLGRFDESQVDPVRQILTELRITGRDRLLIDLRQVAGGSSEAAYRIAGMIVSGALGGLPGRDEADLEFMSQEEPAWSGRLVVLIDGGTQGPAEILATILQQRTDAQLVGQRSFGHAGRQVLLPLSSGDQVLLTDAFYTGPDGEPISQGIDPNVTVSEFTRGFADKDTSIEDLTLEEGIELLSTDDEKTAEEVA
jgi:carboxyl-terminal processing protease